MLPSPLCFSVSSSSKYLDLCPDKLSVTKTEAAQKQFLNLSLIKIQIPKPDFFNTFITALL